MDRFSDKLNDDGLDVIAIFTTIFQIMNHPTSMNISSSDDVFRKFQENMAELRRENSEIFKSID